MPNSLRCKLKKFKHKGLLTEKQCTRLISALDCMDKWQEVFDRCLKAHEVQMYQTNYDIGFHRGLEHAVYLIRRIEGCDEDD